MSMLIVDQEKCKKDGICALECPRTIIQQPEGDFPSLIPGTEEMCLFCGHCVAVCPHGAMRHESLADEEFLDFDKELVIDEKQMEHFLRSRRSIRVYKDRPVEKQDLERVIDIARHAPTGSNTQMVEWTVINGPEKVKAITEASVAWMKDFLKKNPGAGSAYFPLVVKAWEMGQDTYLRSAPALVIASAPNQAGTGATDVVIALSYLELAALPLGLGTCWAGILCGVMKANAPLCEQMGLPKDHHHFYPMMIGYPKYKYQRFPGRKKARINWL